MSDQYVKLEEERRQKERAEKKKKEKKKRKEKRSRGKKHDSGPESEEDITPAHMVDIVTEEMPEVRPSHVNMALTGKTWRWKLSLSGHMTKYNSSNMLLMNIQTTEMISFGFFLNVFVSSCIFFHNLITSECLTQR